MDPNDIHVWSIDLDQPDSSRIRFGSVLNDAELIRANRFRFPKHRRRWTVARHGLREILGRYLDLAPDKIEFTEGPKGKPALAVKQSTTPLYFNLTHSHALALLGITRICELGIDVELHKENRDLDLMARHNFSKLEQRTLAALSNDQKLAGFFNCWTRKEAYLKAVGCGLSHPLDAFDVTLASEDSPRIIAIEGDQDLAERWSLFDLEVPAGFSGAVAIQSTNVRNIDYMEYPGSNG